MFGMSIKQSIDYRSYKWLITWQREVLTDVNNDLMDDFKGFPSVLTKDQSLVFQFDHQRASMRSQSLLRPLTAVVRLLFHTQKREGDVKQEIQSFSPRLLFHKWHFLTEFLFSASYSILIRMLSKSKKPKNKHTFLLPSNDNDDAQHIQRNSIECVMTQEWLRNGIRHHEREYIRKFIYLANIVGIEQTCRNYAYLHYDIESHIWHKKSAHTNRLKCVYTQGTRMQ